jgi:hypothetical protein
MNTYSLTKRRTDLKPNELAFEKQDALPTGVRELCEYQERATGEHVILTGDKVQRRLGRDLDRVVRHELSQRAGTDDFDTARGLVNGFLIGSAMWALIYLAVRWLS